MSSGSDVIVLTDSYEGDPPDERIYVEVTSETPTEEAARAHSEGLFTDGDGNEGIPLGPVARQWLKPRTEPDEHAYGWVEASPTDEGAREFWDVDITGGFADA